MVIFDEEESLLILYLHFWTKLSAEEQNWCVHLNNDLSIMSYYMITCFNCIISLFDVNFYFK